VVLFPFHIPLYIPRSFSNAVLDALSALRIIKPRKVLETDEKGEDVHKGKRKPFVRLNFPLNFVTAPLIADLFLLAIRAIGRQEVHDGTLGANHITPIDIMIFFITLAYIAISIDASGLIRYLAFKVLQKGGKVGHRLFFYLYAFFFALGCFIGNDPIILSGTAFLAYMTRVSSNIIHPRAWIHTQFAIANIASAVLVSSNPTNLVLAGAFNIKFINYTANMIVPVVVTAIVLFPFLLYIVFADESLIPLSIKMHELSEEAKAKKPVNPNIPHARGNAEEEENANNEHAKLLSLEEIMNPFLDKKGAAFGALIMAATLITLLALNAMSQSKGEHPVFWVTLPAAFVMFCWDVAFGWFNRHETRETARKGRHEVELARAERANREEEEEEAERAALDQEGPAASGPDLSQTCSIEAPSPQGLLGMALTGELDEKKQDFPGVREGISTEASLPNRHNIDHERSTLVSLIEDVYRWSQETFPTVTAVLAHLPFALVPFAFAMFVLVQALVTKGWVPVFAYGWDHWVEKTGTVGAIGGMGRSLFAFPSQYSVTDVTGANKFMC
jgi:Na+/H+ antiporter NhaD/arsenite permease-like protein